MNLILLFGLSHCCWMAAARYTWTDKPWIIVGEHEIKEGETLKVSCTLPIDYTGGNCRLFRGNSAIPFRLKTALDFVCVFHLSSKVLLGNHPVGSKISLRCDYQIQEFTSRSSDNAAVIVWGSCPSPSLSVSHHFVSPDDSIEVTCLPPLGYAPSCSFYRGQYTIAEGSCSRNMTGQELAIWEEPTFLLPVNLTCTYEPNLDHYIRSDNSNQHLLLVVDVNRVTTSVNCKVSVSDDQLEVFKDSSWTSAGANGSSVTIQVTNSSLMLSDTCDYLKSLN
ncbi:uncharacterized protein LOC111583769 [Amphiprion ocellaris]|uniref:uncharacterized protein LOC111583769 n=1 Tax=Amphiprion ocellaris TaxID=80972 RepID=UPI002410F264|nr:uncharacterized protein LOC111583769 [Amphiprion ocellaris]